MYSHAPTELFVGRSRRRCCRYVDDIDDIVPSSTVVILLLLLLLTLMMIVILATMTSLMTPTAVDADDLQKTDPEYKCAPFPAEHCPSRRTYKLYVYYFHHINTIDDLPTEQFLQTLPRDDMTESSRPNRRYNGRAEQLASDYAEERTSV